MVCRISLLLDRWRQSERGSPSTGTQWSVLHDRNLTSNPVARAKSVVLTETGLRRAEAAYRRLFKPDG